MELFFQSSVPFLVDFFDSIAQDLDVFDLTDACLMKPTDVDDLIHKAREAYKKRKGLEEKIRVAQTRAFMKTPREIIRETES